MTALILISGIVAFFGLVVYVTDLNKDAAFRSYVIEEIIAPESVDDVCDCDGVGMCNYHIDEMLTEFPLPSYAIDELLHSQSAFPLTDDIDDDVDTW